MSLATIGLLAIGIYLMIQDGISVNKHYKYLVEKGVVNQAPSLVKTICTYPFSRFRISYIALKYYAKVVDSEKLDKQAKIYYIVSIILGINAVILFVWFALATPSMMMATLTLTEANIVLIVLLVLFFTMIIIGIIRYIIITRARSLFKKLSGRDMPRI